MDEEFEAALAADQRRRRRRPGSPPGSTPPAGADAARRLGQGFTFATVSSDLVHLELAAADHLAAAAGAALSRARHPGHRRRPARPARLRTASRRPSSRRPRCSPTPPTSPCSATASLGCVWFGGTQEGVADIDVWFSRLEAGADGWSDPVRLSDDPTRSEQNPILFTAPDGRLWLLHTAQHAGNQDTSFVRVRISDDDGAHLEPDRGPCWRPTAAASSCASPRWCLPRARGCCPSFTCVRVPGEKWVGDQDTSSVWVSTDEGGSLDRARGAGLDRAACT